MTDRPTTAEVRFALRMFLDVCAIVAPAVVFGYLAAVALGCAW